MSLGGLDLPGERFDIVAGIVKLGVGLFQGSRKRTGIDFKQQVAGLDKLVVHHRQIDDRG